MLLFVPRRWRGRPRAKSISSRRRRARSCPPAGSRSFNPSRSRSFAPFMVRDGQTVKAGDVLIELDPTINAAEASRLKSELLLPRSMSRDCRAALTERRHVPGIPAAGRADAEQVATQRDFLLSQVAEYRAKLERSTVRASRRKPRSRRSAALVSKLEAIIPVLRQRFEDSPDAGQRRDRVEAAVSRDAAGRDRAGTGAAVQKSRLREAQAAVRAIVEKQKQVKAEYRRRCSTSWARSNRRQPASSREPDQGRAEDQAAGSSRRPSTASSSSSRSIPRRRRDAVTGADVVVPANSRLEVEAKISQSRHRLHSEPARKPRSRSTPSTSPNMA